MSKASNACPGHSEQRAFQTEMSKTSTARPRQHQHEGVQTEMSKPSTTDPRQHHHGAFQTVMSKTPKACPSQYLHLLKARLRSFELLLECEEFSVDAVTYLTQSFNQLLAVVIKVDTRDRQSLLSKVMKLEPSGLLDAAGNRDELKGAILEVNALLASMGELETATQPLGDVLIPNRSRKTLHFELVWAPVGLRTT